MADIRLPQSPGIGGLNELTTVEEIFVQNLAAIPYENGDILYYDSGFLQRLPIGSENEVLTVSAGGLPEWDTAAGGGAVTSVNTQTGDVVLDADNIDDTSTTNKFVTSTDITNLSNLSGTNTGDQTNITGNAGTVTNGVYTTDAGTVFLAPTGSAASLTDFPTFNQNTTGSAATLTTTRTIWGQNFNGSANITGDITLGASNITMTGSIAATANRVTKVWATDIESTNMPTVGGTSLSSVIQTLTNKRVNPRLVTAASYTTDTGSSLDVATCDQFEITAQAGDLLFNNPSGTPVGGQKLIIRIKDNGTARALTWDTQFNASTDLPLPSTTVVSKTLYMGFIFNATDTKWTLAALLNNI
jgi:hypothetical protein